MTSTATEIANRADAIASIRSRVASKVGTWLKDEECVQLSLACGTRMRREVVEFLFSSQVRRNVEDAGFSEMAMKTEEWVHLFGSGCQPTRSGSLGTVVKEGMFVDAVGRVEKALCRTVQEPAQKETWSKAWHKTASYLAIHMQEDEDFLQMTLGNIVIADMRRLEDLRSELDEEGAEILLLASTIVALSETVT